MSNELRAAAGKFGGNLEGLSIFLGIGFAYTQKKDCSFCCGGGEQSEENESVLCLSKSPERGKHFYFSSAKVLLLFDICKFFGRKIYF